MKCKKINRQFYISSRTGRFGVFKQKPYRAWVRLEADGYLRINSLRVAV